jgi:hypothetical protein
MGQGRSRYAGHDESGRAGAGHAHLHPQVLRPAARAWPARPDACHGPARGRDHLQDAAKGGQHRHLPGRKPRADLDAAAHEAQMPLRSRHPGGDRAAGADPGRHGPPLSAAPQWRGSGRISRSAGQSGRTARRAGKDAGRAAVPGTGDEAGYRRCRFTLPRPTGCAAPWRRSGMSAPCIITSRC